MYRGFTTRCKPLVRLKKRKAGLDFARKHPNKPPKFQNQIHWIDETKINLFQNDGRRKVCRSKGTAQVPKQSTLLVKKDGGRGIKWPYMSAMGTSSLLFIQNVTADSISMNSEV